MSRLVLQGGQAPRISVTGVEAESADFHELLFDGNAKSLKILKVSAASVAVAPGADPAIGNYGEEQVLYGQTFEFPPLCTGLFRFTGTVPSSPTDFWNTGFWRTPWMTYRVGGGPFFRSGAFMISTTDRLRLGNNDFNNIEFDYVVYEQQAFGEA